MKYFALLDDNQTVINISIADDSWDSTGWVEYTLENPAVIDGNLVDGYFYAPQPYPSWTRLNGIWIAPVECPTDGMYLWDESTESWVKDEAQTI